MSEKIDALRQRHSELLAQIAEARDNGADELEIEMLREELANVQAMLHAIAPRRAKAPRARTVSMAAQAENGGEMSLGDRAQFLSWEQADNSLDDEIEAGRKQMLSAAQRGLEALTERQRKVLELNRDGASVTEIAERLGIGKSTVSRTLSRAKKAVREEVELPMAQAALSGQTELDLADREPANLLLSAITPRQAAYLYLYYGEWLSLREVASLIGVDKATVLRTIRRALRNIGAMTGFQPTTLRGMDGLDELAYSIYRELQEQDAVVPQERRPAPPRKGQSSPRKPCEPDKAPMPPLTIIRAKRHRGQMLRELERLSANGQSAQLWLMEIFRKLAKNLKSAGRWLRRNC